MKAISAALVEAQKAFGPALKTSKNPHFKSQYADLAACVEAVIDALNDAGIMLMQQCHESDSGVIVETVFIHESGESISAGKLHVPAQKNDAQGFGSALTYARRYSLMAACGIAPEDDDGNSASRAKHTPAQKSASVHLDTSAMLAAIKKASSMDALKTAYKTAFEAGHACKDMDALAEFEQAKNTRKAELTPQAVAA